MRHSIYLMLPPRMREILDLNRSAAHDRAPLSDDQVDAFYSCTICQSYVPCHLCMIKPEKPGICGNYTWDDARLLCAHSPGGPFRKVEKNHCIHPGRGEWQGINQAVHELSGGIASRWSAYSILEHPETSCRCCECMAAIIPEAQGFMLINQGYRGSTPAGLTFDELLDTGGRGKQVPGILGFDVTFPLSGKFLAAEGGLMRVLWMPSDLKKYFISMKRGEPGWAPMLHFIHALADETVAVTQRDLMMYLRQQGHPALTMSALL